MITTSEHRRSKRYPAKDLAFALLKPYCDKLGQIKDISSTGLAFEYLEFDGFTDKLNGHEHLRIDIIMTPEAFYLSQIPCQVVYDATIPYGQSMFVQGVHTRRCGLQFGELSPDQSAALSLFLEKHIVRNVTV